MVTEPGDARARQPVGMPDRKTYADLMGRTGGRTIRRLS